MCSSVPQKMLNTLLACKGPSAFLLSCRIVTRSESQKLCCLLPKKFCKQGFPRPRAAWLHPSGRIYSLVCLFLGACVGAGGSYLTQEFGNMVLLTSQTWFAVGLFLYLAQALPQDCYSFFFLFCFLKGCAPFQVYVQCVSSEDKGYNSVQKRPLQ